MEYEQSNVTLKAKKYIEIEPMFKGDDVIKLQEGETIGAISCDISGLKLIGILVNGQPNYYYKSHVEQMFDIIDGVIS